MTNLQFVPGSGRQDSAETRKLIRRHVMLGRNEGRRLRTGKATISAASVVKSEHWRLTDDPIRSAIPRRVGSDLSFSSFADEVDPSLMSDTLQFCSATTQNLFVLEPCISFDPAVSIDLCRQGLIHDALYLNVMVFGTQKYLESAVRRNPAVRYSQHYGKALRILRHRLGEAETQPIEVSDTTILAILPLAMQALFNGELEMARNHMDGLSKLVRMRQGGLNAFRSKTKQMIEILRCDISVSLATGHPPLFFADPMLEPLYPLPTSATSIETREPSMTMVDDELATIWSALADFCATVDKAVAAGDKMPEDILLESMAAVMYRLLRISCPLESSDETARLAMLAFCSSTFLNWRQLQMPFHWLKSEFKRSIDHSLRTLSPKMAIWLLTTLTVAYAPLSVDERQDIQSKLANLAKSAGERDWKGAKRTLRSFLWIDLVCDSLARELFDGVLLGDP